jgi:adenosylcobinamide kinase / adenosylcobinamide-phosphate guanylyltransferase
MESQCKDCLQQKSCQADLTKPMTTDSIILVTGPARSGKSEWAEQLARQTNLSVIYIATANTDPNDPEWLARIAKHQQRRPTNWKTLSVPIHLSSTIQAHSELKCCLLIDSLGTWVANLLNQNSAEWQITLQELLNNLEQLTATIIFVAEETGWGVVPAYASGRQFRDRLGELTRRLGSIAKPVYLVTAGHVLNLSILGSPLP